MCYITCPLFLTPSSPEWYTHQNKRAVMLMIKTFNKLGYTVDIIDFADMEFTPRTHYQILFGIGAGFERLASMLGESCLKIYYATGAHWSHQNQAELRRLAALEQRKGVGLKPRRLVQPHK